MCSASFVLASLLVVSASPASPAAAPAATAAATPPPLRVAAAPAPAVPAATPAAVAPAPPAVGPPPPPASASPPPPAPAPAAPPSAAQAGAAAAAAEAPGQPAKALTIPVVGVGEPAPAPGVLQKISELFGDAVSRGAAQTSRADVWQAKVEQARLAYIDLRFKEALTAAEEAAAHLQAHPEDLRDVESLLTAHVYAALAQLELGNEVAAMQRMTSALILRPDFRLSEAEFSPVSITLLERARDRLNFEAKKGELVISSRPGFARIRIDGKLLGETPVNARDLFEGKHFLQASLDGYLDKALWVEVKTGSAQVAVELDESPTEKLRRALADGIIAGAGPDLEQSGRQLARDAGAEVFMLGVSSAGERFLLSGARVPAEGDARRAHTSVGGDLADGANAIAELVATLRAPGPSEPQAVGASLPTAALDYQQHYLGLRPPPKPEFVPPPPPLWKRPWVWGVAAGVAAGAATTVYFVTRPAPPPPSVAVSLQLP